MAEAELYGYVEHFLKEHLSCFIAVPQAGLGQNGVNGTIDVVGLRHVGGDLRGDSELIACEVKDGEPFLKSAGQARAYGVMAHRCYLVSEEDFTIEQRRVAEHLGIGLAKISGEDRVRCTEVQSAPLLSPIPALTQELIEKKLGLASCVICASYFQITDRDNALFTANLVTRAGTRNSIATAKARGTGFVYWLEHQQRNRKDQRTLRRQDRNDDFYDRRYVCSDCVSEFQLGAASAEAEAG